MMKARRNSALTCSGVASVATSKSFGRSPPAGRAPRRRRCRPRGRPPERAHHPHGVVVEQRGSMPCSGRHLHARPSGMPAARRLRGGWGSGLAQQLVDEFLDHGKSLRMRQPRSRAMASSAGRVGGHRVAGAFEQRQVVGGIAVEDGCARSRPSRSPWAPATRHAGDLAFAERGAAGCAPVARPAASRSSRWRSARRCRTAAAIGRVTNSLVAVTMASRSPARGAGAPGPARWAQRRRDHLVDEALQGAPSSAAGGRARARWRSRRRRAMSRRPPCTGVELVVARRKRPHRRPSRGDHELAEGVVGIDGNQRAVEVEQGQVHALPSSASMAVAAAAR
jgi:hypothetical protein